MIIIDLSNIAMAAAMVQFRFSGNVELRDLRKAIISQLESLSRRFASYKTATGVIVACDSTNCWRKQFFPHYKNARKKMREDSVFNFDAHYANLNIVINELIENTPYKVMRVQSAEADDIIATLALRYSDEDTCIVSSDKDILQLQFFNPRISQFSTHKGKFISPSEQGYSLIHHILGGDVGDGVPNVWSDEDVFVVEGKRQKPFTRKMKDATFHIPESELSELLDDNAKERYSVNKILIDLRMIPEDIKSNIVEIFESLPDNSGKYTEYLIKHRLTLAVGAGAY